MDVKQIKGIIEKGENQEVEFKESFHSSQDVKSSEPVQPIITA